MGLIAREAREIFATTPTFNEPRPLLVAPGDLVTTPNTTADSCGLQ